MWFNNYLRPAIWMDGKAPSSKKLNTWKNQYKRMNVFVSLVLEALTRYDIEDLPETVNRRVVLESLLWYGSVVFFKKADVVWALPGMPTEDFTLYGNPTKAIVHGRNGLCETFDLYIPQGDISFGRETTSEEVAPPEGQAVWVRENYLCYPFINHVIDFAECISDTYRTLDVTRANIKRPYVITAEESIIESVKAFFNKRDNNEEYIISSGIFPADKIQMLGMEMNPENIRDCTGLIDYYYAKFRELEAVSATPATIDKKAEITIPELNQNAGAQDAILRTVENVLQEELDFANECLGTNMRFVSNIKEAQDELEDNSEQDILGDKEREPKPV